MSKQIFRVDRDEVLQQAAITPITVAESIQTTVADLSTRVRALEVLALSQSMAAFESSCIYSEFLGELVKSKVDFERDEFRMMLMRSDYQPDRNKHAFRADIEQWEIKDNGYERGGKPCTLEFTVGPA
jgi:hypothetical protein